MFTDLADHDEITMITLRMLPTSVIRCHCASRKPELLHDQWLIHDGCIAQSSFDQFEPSDGRNDMVYTRHLGHEGRRLHNARL